MSQFDVESFMDYYLALFQSKLNSKITEINTEKGGDVLLEAICPEQYTCDANAQVVNYEVFIYYGFPAIIATDSFSGGISEEISMSFEVVMTSPEGGIIDNRKIMRYTRALKEVAFENARSNSQISDLKIETFSPVEIESNLRSPLIKVGGIMITGVIA